MELQHQNEDLKRELELLEQDKHHHDMHLKPLLSSHISAIESNLSEKDIELQHLSNKVKEQSDIIKSLKSENNVLTQQNDKYRIALESNTKQKEILKKSAEDIRFRHSSLQSENSQLKDELHQFHMKLSSLQNLSMYAKSPTHSRCTSPKALILPDSTPRIRSGSTASMVFGNGAFPTYPSTNHISTNGSDESEQLSIDLSGINKDTGIQTSGFYSTQQTPTYDRQLSATAVLPRQTPVFGSAYNSTESNCSAVHILANRVTQYGLDLMDSIHEYPNYEQEIPEDVYEEIQSLRMENDKLKSENIELTQKLTQIKVEHNLVSSHGHSDHEEKCEIATPDSPSEDDEDHNAPYKFIQDEQSTDYETDDSDDEIEELWEKCQGELLYHASEDLEKIKELEGGFIDKFRILWWEFRLHQVNKNNAIQQKGDENNLNTDNALEVIPEISE